MLNLPGAATDAPPRIRERLRDETRAAHERLEARLDIIPLLVDPASRLRTMQRYWGLHAGSETMLGYVLGAVPDLDLPARQRSSVIRDDIAALGCDPAASLPVCPVPALTTGEALGFLYVLEGSTLGGRVIAREMTAQGQSTLGLRFFDAYGDATGAMWRKFLAVLEREAGRGGTRFQDAIVRGALDGFERAEQWLCRKAPGQ